MIRIEHGGRRDVWEALRDGEEDPYRDAGSTVRWREKDLYTLAYDGDRPVASTGLVVAETDAFEVVGVGGVFVTHSYRGRGLARLVLGAALERAETLGPGTAMLFCQDHVVGLYESLGFVDFPGPVTVDQPDGPLVIDYHTMLRNVNGTVPLTIRLRGLPF